MIELTARGTEEIEALRKEYTKRTGEGISQSEMVDEMIKIGHHNLIGRWK
ncbi:MAG: DUF3924 family protein [Candidatus Thorarchaeota archaeon]